MSDRETEFDEQEAAVMASATTAFVNAVTQGRFDSASQAAAIYLGIGLLEPVEVER